MLVQSSMVPLGKKAKAFSLKDILHPQQEEFVLSEAKGKKGTVVMFLCNHCPYVKHIQDELVRMVRIYQKKGIVFVGICSNDQVQYPEDGPEAMLEYGVAHGFNFSYCYDFDQSVARAYKAMCTPDFFVYDADLSCCYRGQFDASRPGNEKVVNGADLRGALDCLLRGETNQAHQIPSIGCSIKWIEHAVKDKASKKKKAKK